MPRRKKDEIVGGTNADVITSSPEKALIPASPYLLQEKIHQDIFTMYEAGVSPNDISRKFPLYSPKEVMELCATEYDLSSIDENQLDAVLLKGFLRDLARLDAHARAHMDNPETFLATTKVMLDARDRTIKYREMLTPKLTDQPEEKQSLTWTIEQKITAIIKEKSPEEAEKLISKLEKASQDEIKDIIDAEFRVADEVKQLAPPQPAQPASNTPQEAEPTEPTESTSEPTPEQLHEQDLKTVIE